MYAQKKGVYYIQVKFSSLHWDKFSNESPEIMLLDISERSTQKRDNDSKGEGRALSMEVVVYEEVICGGHCLWSKK